jgi:hypothetical protein
LLILRRKEGPSEFPESVRALVPEEIEETPPKIPEWIVNVRFLVFTLVVRIKFIFREAEKVILQELDLAINARNVLLNPLSYLAYFLVNCN